MTVERIIAKLLSRFDWLGRTSSFFLKEFPEELEKAKQKLVKKILLEVPTTLKQDFKSLEKTDHEGN